MKRYVHTYKCFRWSCRATIIIAALTFFLYCAALPIVCQANEKENVGDQSIDFTSMSLEELKQVTIISVLKTPQKLSEATSAITVITQDEIRRSGATSIPELLRSVPGLHVAQTDSSTWAVSARGFTGRTANKLLVLMDGRSLYTPLFSGVYWNVQDTVFEDIERIEVIRGPGAALWGANAVNGVINIITKKAEDTQGGLVSSGFGNEERRFGTLRYGEKLGKDAYGRMYLKYFEKDAYWKSPSIWDRALFEEEDDGWGALRGGGRIDWSLSGGNSLTLQGDIYRGEDSERIVFSDPNASFLKSFDLNNEFSGGNVILRGTHEFSDLSEMSLQFYYDRTEQRRDEGNLSQYTERFDTFDIDFQHNFRVGRRQGIIWGLGYRFISDEFERTTDDPNRPVFLIDPASSKTHLVSAFFQDEITIIRNILRFTLGSKFEHNDYTGYEVQPCVRMLWNPSDNQNVWASISRAVRTPSRSEYSTVSPVGVTFPWPSWPQPRMEESENLVAYEVGYRIQFSKSFSLDSAFYMNEYENLTIYRYNAAEAKNNGVELSASWKALPWWHLSASYTYLHMDVSQNFQPPPADPNYPHHHDPNFPDAPPPGPPPFDISPETSSPNHQFVIRSSMDLYQNVELDLDLRYVDNLDIYVDSYWELDARLGWNPRKDIELSLVGQNLFHDHHPEFLSHGFLPFSAGKDSEVERSIYGKITCRF
ncbi:MAG: TonB-dependent receptor plug domain-containing protein [bacterium]